MLKVVSCVYFALESLRVLNGFLKLSGMILVVVDGYRLFRSVKSELVLDSVNVVVGCIVYWLF